MIDTAYTHVYIAYRLTSPDRAANIEAAGRLLCELADRLPIVPYASWLTLARYWDESMRNKGLTIDRAQISRCDELWHTGPELSGGMLAEGGFATEFDVDVVNHVGRTVDEIVAWWREREEREHGGLGVSP